ncbi:efflux RND transporter periplasmic adaptor subunit [Novosphingobium ovatum]|uniref:efflux RND transporter periplasmic adaptor subunit n=1 Tax=Novosphingobium ovatum TaxID=1908523 RepID=UPI0029FEECD9|nr:efflux RND transporter periplasmic adaptor subunit [Novosphingobium ovatum]
MSTPADHTATDRPRSRWTTYGLVLAGLVATGGLAKYVASSSGQKSMGGRPAAAVGVARVDLADVPVQVAALGTVTPVDSATVRTQLSGNVTAVLFAEGQIVQQGQVIAQIDPRPYRLALAQAQGTLARDMAQLESARADLRRYETLAGQDSIARQQVDTQRASVKQLEGTVAYDRAAVGTAQLNLQYTAVKAPFTGRIGLKQVSVGTYATPSDTNGIAVITRVDPIDVAFSVPQGTLAAIRQKPQGGAGLPVTALDQDGKTTLASGSFRTLDNQIDTTTGTVKAKARFTGASDRLFPNAFVNIRMQVDTLRQVPVVPVSAVRHGAPGDFVFVVRPDNTVKLTVVKTGPSDGTRTAILSGLTRGATVVAEGADGLDDGSKVSLPGAKPAAKAGQ